MKKYIIIILLSLVSLTAWAKAPNLHVESMFDGSYNSNRNVSLNVYRTPENFFRGCTVTDDKALVKKITQLFEKDLPRASHSQEIINNGSSYRSMVVMNNNEEIYIGLSFDNNNGCYLFINGPASAFK